MLIVYSSKTGNVQRFVNKLDLPCVKIEDDLVVSELFILLTYTTGFGEVPQEVMDFMSRGEHMKLIVAVSASGNRNWGQAYCKAGDTLAAMCKIPILSKFELSGTPRDIRIFKEGYDKLCQNGLLSTMN
ncbi:class Ib ribonucleoside-diphosphate reductase assembly flavoprotein NrdI [Paenibacillus alvei]|uniref:class Ib ribonucleoside-diphosphate reductase assembly flavoprotein NrdI n=1 Tax=Paenibacillus alvei TaxID=44250 RepID=UPI00228032F3|nr:class Ib ribonucleoside-diphosphate reductase assembly flavoprotein NrdI [Paenibacillus alvei]MCY9737532.1 class Ib ribonucleoside-diphosphate reductase assembly flavoprotein NrdI [Paenibacillus alvei]